MHAYGILTREIIFQIIIICINNISETNKQKPTKPIYIFKSVNIETLVLNAASPGLSNIRLFFYT